MDLDYQVGLDEWRGARRVSLKLKAVREAT